MKGTVNTFTMLFVVSCVTGAFAAEGDQHGSMGAMMGQMHSEASPAIDEGNKICPVSGEKIGKMGPGAQYEYKGKIYNFCCTNCVEAFKKDPEKYIKIVQDQLAQEEKMGEGEIEEPEHVMLMEDPPREEHHRMDEMGGHMMTGMAKEHAMMSHHQGAMMMDEAQVKDINLEAYQFDFSPKTIIVNKGDLVRIHATSRDVPHGVFIKEYGIDERVEKGKVTDIEFTADKAGEFDIRCSVYCGRGHRNMKAKLIVKK